VRRFDWTALDSTERASVLQRPISLRSDELRRSVARIIEQVRADGDATLRALTRKFDGVELGELRVSAAEIAEATAAIRSSSATCCPGLVTTTALTAFGSTPQAFSI